MIETNFDSTIRLCRFYFLAETIFLISRCSVLKERSDFLSNKNLITGAVKPSSVVAMQLLTSVEPVHHSIKRRPFTSKAYIFS